MFSIQQRGNQWAVLSGTDQVGDLHGTYDDALDAISALLGAQLAAMDGEGATSPDGLLPERWTTSTGVAFSEPTDDGRDFTGCTWSFRDPAVYPLPLMHQTCTDMGHFGAEAAGYADTVDENGGTPIMGGRFYDSESGRALRDQLLSARVGVSVDPGQVDMEFVCTAYDDDGWCDDGEYHFLAYQIIGLTATPFPGFERATIELEGFAGGAVPAAADAAPAEPVAASATFAALLTRPVTAAAGATLAAPIRPPASWFHEPEPELGDPRLVEQQDGSLACPLTITDDGQVYGHMARWGQCHVANPQGADVCTTPPETTDYDVSYHLGHVVCEGGEDVATGALIAGCDHASTRLSVSAAEARDHYAHSGVAWADVRASNGEFGPWVCGALRPEVTELQLRVLRASSLSGDWREIPEMPGEVSLIAGLATNVPGFGISRRALVASGMEAQPAQTRAAVRDGQVVALVASGVVQACPDCARRAQLARAGGSATAVLERKLDEVLRGLDVLDRRTAHLRTDAALALAKRLGRD